MILRRTFIALSLSLAAALALPTVHAEPKKVILVTTTTGFRHGSIPFAQKTLAKLAESSGAFTIVDQCEQPNIAVPKKPNKPSLKDDADEKAKAKFEKDMAAYEAAMAKWTPEMDAQAKAAQEQFDAAMKATLEKLSPENLRAKGIDAVIFANTTGMLPLPDRDGFIKWIEDGHAFIATHSGSDTFHQFPGYLDMLGGEFETHKAQVSADLVSGDTQHPANAGIGGTWNIKQEEMYHIKRQDRSKVRALWYLRHDPNNVDDKRYFAVSWCKNAGKGRVFYTSLGHREDLWSDDPALPGRINSVEISKQYQAHLIGGIKWALGLAEGSMEPNPDAQ